MRALRAFFEVLLIIFIGLVVSVFMGDVGDDE
jgi:hypothetical protein